MPYDIRFRTSFNCLVSGPAGSGKTTWVKNLLLIGNQIFTVKPKKRMQNSNITSSATQSLIKDWKSSNLMVRFSQTFLKCRQQSIIFPINSLLSEELFLICQKNVLAEINFG